MLAQPFTAFVQNPFNRTTPELLPLIGRDGRMTDEILARATEIARSGACPDVGAVKTALRREGYDGLDALFAQRDVLQELGRLCRQAHMKVRRRPSPPQEDDF